MTMRILVTGGAGMIGSHAAEQFALKGARVTVFVASAMAMDPVAASWSAAPAKKRKFATARGMSTRDAIVSVFPASPASRAARASACASIAAATRSRS